MIFIISECTEPEHAWYNTNRYMQKAVVTCFYSGKKGVVRKVSFVRGLQLQQLHIDLTLKIRARKHNAWHDFVEASMCAVHQLHMLSNQIELFKWLTQLSGLS